MHHPKPDDRANAILAAQYHINSDPLFLDTETTGLSGRHEICEIAIVNLAGEVLINTLVKPTVPIDHNTSQIHGITNEMVANAPTFGDLLPSLDQILRGRTVLVYNSEFDIGKLWQSGCANRINWTDPAESNVEAWWRIYPWHCAMELYAAYYGDWNDYHGNYRWQRLSNAALQCGIELPVGIHRAHADAELTRRVVMHMAEQIIQKTRTNEESKDDRTE